MWYTWIRYHTERNYVFKQISYGLSCQSIRAQKYFLKIPYHPNFPHFVCSFSRKNFKTNIQPPSHPPKICYIKHPSRNEKAAFRFRKSGGFSRDLWPDARRRSEQCRPRGEETSPRNSPVLRRLFRVSLGWESALGRLNEGRRKRWIFSKGFQALEVPFFFLKVFPRVFGHFPFWVLYADSTEMDQVHGCLKKHIPFSRDVTL